MRKINIFVCLALALGLTACADMRGRDIGTIAGAGGGALVGSQLTGNPAVGAVLGAVGGGAIGHYAGKGMEK